MDKIYDFSCFYIEFFLCSLMILSSKRKIIWMFSRIRRAKITTKWTTEFIEFAMYTEFALITTNLTYPWSKT